MSIKINSINSINSININKLNPNKSYSDSNESSRTNSNKSESDNSNINPIKNFWDKKVWEVDYKSINNCKIANIFKQYEKLKNSSALFKFDFNYEIHIIDNKKENKKKFLKFKKDNLNFLKTHADYFYEYHLIIFNFMSNKNLHWEPKFNKNFVTNINTYTCSDKENIFVDLVEKDINIHLKHFLKCIVKNTNFHKHNIDLDLDFDNLKKDIVDKLNMNLNKNSFIKFINANTNTTLNQNNKPFVIIDVENILKSLKIQNFLKFKLDHDEFIEYFNIWLNGDFKFNGDEHTDLSNMSVSQYSSKVKYIEPFTSLNLSIEKKIKLIKIIIDSLLNNYNTINIIGSNHKIQDDNLISNISNILNISNNHFFIPITYEKNDIREQDDHLILFIYTLLKKKKYNVLMLSNDKFKWYSNQDEIFPSNFKFLYDFDNLSKELIIDDAYTPDIYRFNSNYFIFPFVNYPIIDYIYFYEKNIDWTNINICHEYINWDDNDFVESQYENIYCNLIKLSINDSIKKINFNYNILTEFLDKYLLNIHKIFMRLFDFLNSQTKKELFKLSICNKQHIFSQKQIELFIFSINKYKSLIEIFQIIKVIGIKFYSDDKKFILWIISYFSSIIEIYDLIQSNQYKIRKLSNSKSNLAKLFLILNSTYIYVKKQGFLKKNY